VTTEYDVTRDVVRDRMTRELGRVATPAIVIGKRVFWGFEVNRSDISDLLGVEAGVEAGMPPEGE
jgi:hypothetical protein